jgi:hypothetical protein
VEPVQVWPGRKVAWGRTEARIDPVPPEVRILDRRSGQALAEGAVDLPRRRVQVGVWFRLLRSLLDELSSPLRYLRRQREPILDLWESLALPPRGGVGKWKPFESYGDAEQETLLRAAARALALIEAGEMEAPGEAADLFRCEPLGEDWPGRVVAAVRAKDRNVL